MATGGGIWVAARVETKLQELVHSHPHAVVARSYCTRKRTKCKEPQERGQVQFLIDAFAEKVDLTPFPEPVFDL